jgi:hypothetical protein
LGRVGSFDGSADFDAQGAAVVGALGGVEQPGERGDKAKNHRKA